MTSEVAEQTPCKLNKTQGYTARQRNQKQRLLMSYQHLSLEERHYIELSMKNEKTFTEIAKDLGRSQCTISREVKRNLGQKGYRHKQANCMAQERHINRSKSNDT